MESAIFMKREIDLTRAFEFIDRHKGRYPHLSIFHIFIATCKEVLYKRPRLNQFVLNRKLYRNQEASISFAVRKNQKANSPITVVKIKFKNEDSFETMYHKIEAAKEIGRNKKPTSGEKEIMLLKYMPDFLVYIILKLFKGLDALNLIPHSMLKNDPLYASVMAANLGSLGMDAAYHHLYEWGTISIVAILGKIEKKVFIDPSDQVSLKMGATVKITGDERICDGYYTAKSFALFQDIFENPNKTWPLD
jgi:hypothetical protein